MALTSIQQTMVESLDLVDPSPFLLASKIGLANDRDRSQKCTIFQTLPATSKNSSEQEILPTAQPQNQNRIIAESSLSSTTPASRSSNWYHTLSRIVSLWVLTPIKVIEACAAWTLVSLQDQGEQNSVSMGCISSKKTMMMTKKTSKEMKAEDRKICNKMTKARKKLSDGLFPSIFNRNDVRRNHQYDEGRVLSSIREEFEQLKVLGAGSFGTVTLCRIKSSGNLCALKILSKKRARELNQQQGIRTEKRILTLNHPFFVKMYCSFQTKSDLYFVLEYCRGGDLFNLLEQVGHFNEDVGRFYAACILLALRYLHDLNILYRDLKPENLLIDRQGFIRLADFGLAKEGVEHGHRTKSFCGSVDYLAPEVLEGGGYGKPADVWSFGCLLFELLTGFPPFYSPKDRIKLYAKIKAGRVIYPSYLSDKACDLLSRLLTIDPNHRLGAGLHGWVEIMEHSFFEGIDWFSLQKRKCRAPYEPDVQDDLDTRHFGSEFTSQLIEKESVWVSFDHSIEVDDKEVDANDGDFGDFDWCDSTLAEPSSIE